MTPPIIAPVLLLPLVESLGDDEENAVEFTGGDVGAVPVGGPLAVWGEVPPTELGTDDAVGEDFVLDARAAVGDIIRWSVTATAPQAIYE